MTDTKNDKRQGWVQVDNYAQFISDWEKVESSSKYSLYSGPWRKRGEDKYCLLRRTEEGLYEMRLVTKKVMEYSIYV